MESNLAASLRAEASKLQSRLDDINAKMDALVDEQHDLHADLDAIRRILARLEPSVPSSTPPVAVTHTSGGKLSGLGLRDAIRKVLDEASGGLRPREIRKALEEEGFQQAEGITTDLGVRIGNEVHRMAKLGKLRRRAGRYLPPQRQSELI